MNQNLFNADNSWLYKALMATLFALTCSSVVFLYTLPPHA